MRFEDLALALIYRMNRWGDINHFGKKGKDSGIDIKAVEILENGKKRNHCFQCKRYIKLTKAQLKIIMDDFVKQNDMLPDKYYLVIGCNISKQLIEYFQAYAKEKGISSSAIWTASILETMLYAEHHDLLFAYFGVSLTHQRNEKKQTVRRNISLKHKMHRDFQSPVNEWKRDPQTGFIDDRSKFICSEILIRSIDDVFYPENKLIDGMHYGYGKYGLFNFYHNGLIVAKHWVKVKISPHKDEVIDQGDTTVPFEAKALTLGYIPYANIVDYDIDGDEYYRCPHLFCDFAYGFDPFEYTKYAVEYEGGFFHHYSDDEVEVL
ncbi:hypothetical protein LJC56_04325 [Christensenellaceae bacterium OttesenSCG-928-K19]|nr:hypothetical protein [Christensenellaceae bacterium OttesenSCG-928-K19]